VPGLAMRKLLLIIVAGLLSGQAVRAEQVMYQWRDRNNVLHVSQLPPATGEYQTIVLGAKSPTPAAATATTQSKAPASDLQESCTKAKENLRILQQDLPVYLDLEDGRQSLLDDAQREQQRQLAEKQIGMFCKEPDKAQDQPQDE